MDSFIQDFTKRQYMVTPDFEFFHYADTSTTEIEFHNHDFYELFCLISGNVKYVIEGRSYELSPGDIIIVDNKDLHRPFIGSGEVYERIVIWLRPEFLRTESIGRSDLTTCFESKQDRGSHLLSMAPAQKDLIWDKLYSFERACHGFSFGNEILKKLYLLELLVYINRIFIGTYGNIEDEKVSSNEKINEIIIYISKNLERNLTLDLISSTFFISKYHLIRLFKKYTGFTLHKYIMQKRLIKAKHYLRKGKNVTETALLCGFSDYSNFVRAFSKHFDQSPKNYFKQFVNKTHTT